MDGISGKVLAITEESQFMHSKHTSAVTMNSKRMDTVGERKGGREKRAKSGRMRTRSSEKEKRRKREKAVEQGSPEVNKEEHKRGWLLKQRKAGKGKERKSRCVVVEKSRKKSVAIKQQTHKMTSEPGPTSQK